MNLPIVLASASPRRQELLKQLQLDFIVDPAHLDEDALSVEDPFETAKNLALAKAQAVLSRHPDRHVIGCDTVVALHTDSGWVQYTKPVDAADAERILTELSGKTHLVITGVAVVSANGIQVDAGITRVTFRDLSRQEILDYIATGDPMDKAGAYGAQNQAGGFIANLEGGMDNVIGLPVDLLRKMLIGPA